MSDTHIDREALRQRIREVDKAFEALPAAFPAPDEQARQRMKLCAEYAKLGKLLVEGWPMSDQQQPSGPIRFVGGPLNGEEYEIKNRPLIFQVERSAPGRDLEFFTYELQNRATAGDPPDFIYRCISGPHASRNE